MDQHKVEIVSLELPKGFFPRSLCLFIAKLRYPNLCGEENILPATTQFLDSALNTFANFFFVVVGLCGVDQTIAGSQRIKHTFFEASAVSSTFIFSVDSRGTASRRFSSRAAASKRMISLS